MAYVPEYEHDIFVSYAHVDDIPLPGIDDEWVTTLVNNLKVLVSQSLGRTDTYSLWMDYRLTGNVAITPAILDTISKSATLVIVLSPGYLTSEWCQQEKNVFQQALSNRSEQYASIFVVEKHQLEDDEYPKEFRDLLGYKFWEEDKTGKIVTFGFPCPSPSDSRYYDVLTTLATELVDSLKQKRAHAISVLKSPPRIPEFGVQSPVVDVPTDAEALLRRKIAERHFDVFLCHNSDDKTEVKEIGKKMLQLGLRPWLDEWELQPGLPWQLALEKQIEQIESAAVFVGGSGFGPWQAMELEAYLRHFVTKGVPVIPVILSSCKATPQLPTFLSGMTWVDFRINAPDPIERLYWGITGHRLN